MAPPDDFRAALVRLLDTLDGISTQHGEVHDTMVREMTFDSLYRGFLRDGNTGEVGDRFGMFSDEGNAAVKSALASFFSDPAVVNTRHACASPQERLNAFQAPGIASGEGSTTDEYFGYVDSLD